MNCNIETQVVFCCLCCRKIQRLCKARAEAKFTWIMPSRRQFSCKRVQSRTCSGYAERSRKSRRSGTTPKDIPHHCISANSSDRPGRHLSIATIRVYFCDDNGDNLRQLEVVLGATEMPRNIIAHELHKNS